MGVKNPGISYEFSVPKSVTKLPDRAQFSWRTGEFDKCSATCAGGKSLLRVVYNALPYIECNKLNLK